MQAVDDQGCRTKSMISAEMTLQSMPMTLGDTPRLMSTDAELRNWRILHLEDSEDDHALVLLQLRRAGVACQLVRIDTLAALDEALAGRTGSWDAILSDYNLPGFTGVDALARFRQAKLCIPFILISGEMGEDMAVAAMRDGASDYLLKHNLQRLGPALEHALAASAHQRAHQHAQAELAASEQRLADLAQHLQQSVEQERQAIAREIHDDLGGALTALKFDLAWMERHSSDESVRERARQATETVRHAIGAGQRIMQNLRPAILDQGLVAAIQWQVRQFSQRTGLAARFRGDDQELPELPTGVAVVVYRMVQEALTNITKHARAHQVNVDLSLSADVLSVEVQDDGKGLSPADRAKVTSYGLLGLRERAAGVGGWLEVSSQPGRGTSLLLSIPLTEAAAARAAGDLTDSDDEGSA
jgi:signal transduction histidine kinase